MSDSLARQSPWQFVALLRDVYRGVPLTLQQRLTTVYRPLYGSFDRILAWVPDGARHVDVGCGTGALLFAADRVRQLESGYGIDISPRSIALAQQVNRTGHLRFVCGAEAEPGALAAATAISLIDVLHHVRNDEKLALLDRYGRHAAPGSVLIVKDLHPVPRWRALANRLTDFVSTRSRVEYLPWQRVAAHLNDNGFAVLHQSHWLQHVWSHYLLVARRR